MYSYKKLWKLLIDKDMSKKELSDAAGIGPATVYNIAEGKNTALDTLVRICIALDCTLDDIVEIKR